MGKYFLGKMIEKTRTFKRLSQEELANDICSVETISRLENGRQVPVKENFEKIMKKLGRETGEAYITLDSDNLEIFDCKKRFEDYIKQYDFVKANQELVHIEEMCSDTQLNKQYLKRAKALVQYSQHNISQDDFLKELEEAIKLTLPQYGLKSIEEYPLVRQEIMILNTIAIAYVQKGDIQKAILIWKELNVILQNKYVDMQEIIPLRISMLRNYSKSIGDIGEYEKAIKIADEGITLCKTYKIKNVLVPFLIEKEWNLERKFNAEGNLIKNKEACIQLLSQAYHLAIIFDQKSYAASIYQHCSEEFNKELPIQVPKCKEENMC